MYFMHHTYSCHRNVWPFVPLTCLQLVRVLILARLANHFYVNDTTSL